MNIEIISDTIQDFKSITEKINFKFKYNNLFFIIPQISAYDYDRLSEILYKSMLIRINSDLDTTTIKKELEIILERSIDKVKTWDLLINSISYLIKPTNKFTFIRYCIANLFKNKFKRSRCYITLNGFLKKEL
jgi:hypothetical protein